MRFINQNSYTNMINRTLIKFLSNNLIVLNNKFVSIFQLQNLINRNLLQQNQVTAFAKYWVLIYMCFLKTKT